MEHPEDSPAKVAPIDRNRELLKTAREEIYKSVAGVELPAYIWLPDPAKAPSYPKSVVAFFYSSGWDNGQVSQFAPHCVYFAARGMLAVAFDYRVSARHEGATPLDAMADARSAMRWLRVNAVELGINPGKIVGAGGSGGAHAIAAAAMLPATFDEHGEDAGISCVPNALALFNPILDTTKRGFGFDRFPSPDLAKKSSLPAAIKAGLPPTILFHGTQDRVIPHETTFEFARKMKKKKNPTEVHLYEGLGHGFFNFNVSFDVYQATINQMDDFLIAQGFVEADPEGRVEMM